MIEHNPPTSAEMVRPPVNPVPIALYVSGELIFELYDGGQPYRRFSIRWERLSPIEQRVPEPAFESPQTGLHTHQE